jgi:site-specific recombinase XerD
MRNYVCTLRDFQAYIDVSAEDITREELLEYYHDNHPTDYLFTSNNRKAGRVGISNRGVQYIVNCAREHAQIRKEFCLHTLRHCFAVSYLNNGGNLLRLKQLLGHISTTRRYLEYASLQLKGIPSPLAFLPDA